MKISLLLTAAILLAGAALGWKNQQRINTAQTQATQVVAAARHNIPPPDPTSTHRPRPTTDIPTLAAELIAFARELETNPETSSPGQREQTILDWQRRLSSLNPGQIKTLIAEIQKSPLEDSTRDDLLRITLQALSANHPAETLSILSTDPDLFKNPWLRASVATEALLRGMEKDPAASIAWFKENRGTFGDTARDHITEKLLRGTGIIDPKLAFRLISDLSIADSGYAVRMILNPSRDNEQRDAALAAFREYLDSITDPAVRENLSFEGNGTLIANAMNHGFDKGLAWTESAGFSQQELEAETSRSIDAIVFTDPAKWFDWLSRNVPTDTTFRQTIPTYIREWTQLDYQTAGKWLGSVPDGQLKYFATLAYMEALLHHHPEISAHWFDTLPPTSRNENTRKEIHRNLLRTNPAAAADFARRHSIPSQ